MNEVLSRGRRALRRSIDRVRWHGEVRTVLRGPAAGLRIGTRCASAEYAEGTNEAHVQEALTRLLRPGDTFVDVGANVGFFSLLAARRVGAHGRVIAFEAVPTIAAALMDNVRLNDLRQIEVRPLAIGAAPGRAVLRLTKHPGGATIASDADAQEVTETIDVEVASLDALVDDGSLPPPDVVKIDVEGSELDALVGMSRTVAERRPSIVVELDAASPDRLASKRAEVEALLARWDYVIEPLPPSYPHAGWSVVHLVARGK